MTPRPNPAAIDLAALRDRATRCLANESPSAAEAHELAATVLAALGALESEPAVGAPYRTAGRGAESDEDLRSLVALERALEECQEKLRAARARESMLARDAKDDLDPNDAPRDDDPPR